MGLHLGCPIAIILRAQVAKEDEAGGSNNHDNAPGSQGNEVCDFVVLRQVLDLVDKLTRLRIDPEDKAIALHA